MRPSMRASVLVPAICFALLPIASCDRSHGYRGDGTFTDFGPATAIDGYVVDLGRIDLSRPNQQSFRLWGLPGVEFTVGLRPVNVSAGCDAMALRLVRVRLEVKSGDGDEVVDEDGPLSTWVDATELVYRRGVALETREAGGASRFVRTGVRASGGWGTYFTPRQSAPYFVKFDVVDAQGASACESHLVLLGGGWK
jgi:hypothetical protein